MIKKFAVVAAVANFLVASAAWAQEAPMTITRGTISSVTATTLETKGRNGQSIPVTLTDKTKMLLRK